VDFSGTIEEDELILFFKKLGMEVPVSQVKLAFRNFSKDNKFNFYSFISGFNFAKSDEIDLDYILNEMDKQ